MANYHEMDRDALTAEKAALEQAYKEFQAKGLKLNMARGKPGPHQMDLAMDRAGGSERGTRPVCRCVRRKAQRGVRGRQLQPAADVQPHQHRLCVRLPGVSLPLVSGREAQVPLPGARL